MRVFCLSNYLPQKSNFFNETQTVQKEYITLIKKKPWLCKYTVEKLFNVITLEPRETGNINQMKLITVFSIVTCFIA
jgi:hypothetical protein